MSGDNITYYGPISYSPIWLILGLIFIGAAVAIVVVIFYVTRKKEIKTVSTLKVTEPKIVDMAALRRKYIKLINEAEERFRSRKIKASQCHQQISLLVRLFYYEALGFHADVMTLSDLKKTNHKKLVDLISSYYPEEFNTLEKGSVADAAERARKQVQEL